MWPGRLPLFLTPLYYLAVVTTIVAVQHVIMPRFGQVRYTPNVKVKANITLLGRKTFELRHNAYSACGISDGDTIVMTGGGSPLQNYVHRCAS